MASNPGGQMQFWLNGAPFGGLQLGTNDGGEMQFWFSGNPYGWLFPATGSQIKNLDGILIASVKNIDGILIASVKNWDGITNV